MEKGSLSGGHKVMKGTPRSSLEIQKHLLDNTMCQAQGQVLKGTVMTTPWALASKSSPFPGKMLQCARAQSLMIFQTFGSDF